MTGSSTDRSLRLDPVLGVMINRSALTATAIANLPIGLHKC